MVIESFNRDIYRWKILKATHSTLKKIVVVILVASLALGILHFSGYISKSGTSDKIVIGAFNYYIDTAKEAVKEYQKTHPNTEFEIVELGQDDLVEKFRIALASGNKANLPDIIVEEYYNLKGYLEFYGDYFADLTTYVEPSLYVDFTVKSVTYNDKIWAIPYDTGVGAWFYREDILSEAGFSEADVQNITWDRFVEIGKVVKEKTGKYMIPLLPEGNIEGRVMLQSAGSWYYDYDGNLDIVNNKALVDMTKTIKMLAASGVVYEVTSWADIIAAFYNGNAAGVIGGG
jgi:lactose/L-arabinose transport system substrate-binding protein